MPNVSCSKCNSYDSKHLSITHLDVIHPGRSFTIYDFLLHFSFSQCISQGHHLINNHKASYNTNAYEMAGFFISLFLSPHLFQLAADKRKSKAPDTHFSWRRGFMSLWSMNKIQFQSALLSIWKMTLWISQPLSGKDPFLKMFTCIVLSKALMHGFCKCHLYM